MRIEPEPLQREGARAHARRGAVSAGLRRLTGARVARRGGRLGARDALAVAPRLVERVGVDGVGAVAARHRVAGAVAHADVVVAAAPVDRVDAAAGLDLVVAVARHRGVVARAGEHVVVAGARLEVVVAVAADDDVVASRGREPVGPGAADRSARDVEGQVELVLALAEVDADQRDPAARAERLDRVTRGVELAGAAASIVDAAVDRRVAELDLGTRRLDRQGVERRRVGGGVRDRRPVDADDRVRLGARRQRQSDGDDEEDAPHRSRSLRTTRVPLPCGSATSSVSVDGAGAREPPLRSAVEVDERERRARARHRGSPRPRVRLPALERRGQPAGLRARDLDGKPAPQRAPREATGEEDAGPAARSCRPGRDRWACCRPARASGGRARGRRRRR